MWGKKLVWAAFGILIIGLTLVRIEQTINSPQESEKISGAYNALHDWSLQRAYPNKDIPADAFMNAYEEVKQIRLEKSNWFQTTDPWKTIGPHNTGGRTIALAFNPQNPNTIYAGSASGGLWVSYSAGVGVNAWHYVPTNYPVLGVSSIAIVPDDSNTIYIGTGEVYNYNAAATGAGYRSTRGTYGIGILKTTDGGATWTKSLDWSYNDEHGVWAIEINPLNPNTVWAATTDGTYKSHDAGASWQRVNNVVMAMDLIINPADTNIVLTGNGNFQSPGYGIYRTSDGGGSWTKITNGLPTGFRGKIQLDIYKANPNIMFASIGDGFQVGEGASWLCRSTNAGLSWTIRSTTDYSKHQGWYSHGVAVNQSNPNELIIVGIEVYKSIDGGSTLTIKSTGGLVLGRPPIGGPEGGSNYTHSDAHIVVQHPTDPLTYYIGTDGGVFRTRDFGETFESCNGRYQTTQFYNGTSSSQTDSLFAMGGLQDNATIIYDGDLAWIRRIGGDGSWTAIDATNDNMLFGSYYALNMYRSINRGNNFVVVTPPGGNNPTAFIAPFKIAYGNSNIIYGGRNIIFKSTNAGNGWFATNGGIPLDGNFAFAMDISYQNSNKVYVATAPYSTFRGNLFRTDNGGSGWIYITGNLPDRFPADIAVDPNDDNIVYVTFYGFGSSHIYKSTDSGTNWIDTNGNLPDIPTPAVIVDPFNSNHVYAGTDIGVFVSTEGGGNWQDYSEGLPDAVQVMDLNITSVNHVLRVMTHGNGAYERKLLSTSVTGIEDDQTITSDFRLEQNYPNPFNPSTTITYQLPVQSEVELRIYNSIGQLVKTLVREKQSAGTKSVTWNGRDDHGNSVGSGVYVYSLRAGGHFQSKKMMLIK